MDEKCVISYPHLNNLFNPEHMQTKLQELTEKLYQEGIGKANEEAGKIISDARSQADELIREAKKQADDLIKNAQREADDLQKNTLNELQLSARQLVSDLKLRIAELIEAKTISPEAKNAFKDTEFTQQIVKTIIEKWNPASGEHVELSLMLSASQKKEFEAFFASGAKSLMEKGLELNFSDKIKGGLKIGPKDGGYMISLTDDDFENLFQAYLRPRLIELLFTKK